MLSAAYGLSGRASGGAWEGTYNDDRVAIKPLRMYNLGDDVQKVRKAIHPIFLVPPPVVSPSPDHRH